MLSQYTTSANLELFEMELMIWKWQYLFDY